MNLKYHGIVVNNDNSGQLRFGIEPLIGNCQSWVWNFKKDLPDTIKESLKRFNNRAYWQCAKKCKDTVYKINKAVYNLGRCIDVFEHQEEYSFDGAPIDKAAKYFKASDDIPYHLDSLISYLRILADCIAFAIPFFYRTDESIANRSFRDQRKWFLEKKPDFDEKYSDILKHYSLWFDKLAGKSPKGVRDVMFHNFGTYQLGCAHFPDGKNEIFINQITSEGILDQDLAFTLTEIIYGFFSYLDQTYSLFGVRIAEEFSPFITSDLVKRSVFMIFKNFDNFRKKYRLYPIIEPSVVHSAP